MQLSDPVDLRHEMVEHHIKARGVHSTLVVEAMSKVPREQFVPEALREFAYDDSPLPIAAGQTIPQPYIVAVMIEALALNASRARLLKRHFNVNVDYPSLYDVIWNTGEVTAQAIAHGMTAVVRDRVSSERRLNLSFD